MELDLRISVLLSFQRALWDHVTPDLRGVAVSWSGETDYDASVRARFLFEGLVDDVRAECTSLAETYVLADFPPSASVQFDAVAHAERILLPGEEWVYLRWEGF